MVFEKFWIFINNLQMKMNYGKSLFIMFASLFLVFASSQPNQFDTYELGKRSRRGSTLQRIKNLTQNIDHEPVGIRTPEGKLKLDERQYKDRLLSVDQTFPCKKTYCEKVADYPAETINELNLDPFSAFFESPASTDRSDTRANQPTSGVSDDPREEYLCVGIQKRIWPMRAQLHNGKNWMNIINTDVRKQAITIEECSFNITHPDLASLPCKYEQHFPQNVKSLCKQFYGVRQLVAISDDEKIKVDEFIFPSHCKCVVHKDV